MPSNIWSRRDLYPPTQIRLSRCNKNEPRPLLEDIDESPLTYFLTPSDTDNDLDDFGADEMLLDAGIEDSKHPRDHVRSVSPSTLDGLGKLRAKSVSPDFDSDAITTDEEDEEDCIRFHPPTATRSHPPTGHSLTPARRSFGGRSAETFQPRSESPSYDRATNGGSITLAASFPAPAYSPSRTTSRGRPRQPLTRSYSAGSRLPPRALRLWREPSHDVWSIVEETEEDLLVMEASVSSPVTPAFAKASKSLQEPAAKPKKKVRFLLPPRD
ncbi:hypothetical protein E4U41_000602 [Claviceps citrina]|nr:hypothetical protein E4U41_000602 [Claviceps citrina]